MPVFDLSVIVPVVAFGAFLWVGLFILSRASVQTPLTITSSIGMFAQSAFFLITVVNQNNQSGLDSGIFYSRLSWPTNCIPSAIWFHISQLVAGQDRDRRAFTPFTWLVYLAGIALSAVGMFSNLFLDYAGAGLDRNQHVYVGVGSLYELYILYLLVTLGGSFAYLVRGYYKFSTGQDAGRKAIRTQMGLLASGTVLFLVGGLMLSIKFKFILRDISEYIPYSFLLIGLGLFGFAVAQYGMLVEGKDIRRDFAYSLSAQVITNLVFCLAGAAISILSPIAAVILVGLVILNNSLYDWGREQLDKIFFSKAEQAARNEARVYAIALASQPVAISNLVAEDPPVPADTPPPALEANNGEVEDDKASRKAFYDAVRRAISGIKNPTQLVQSPLLTLSMVDNRLKQQGLSDNRLNRATALKEILIELLERLRPSGDLAYGTTDAWRYYNVLYFPYVREISKKSAYAEARRLAQERLRNKISEPGEIEKVLEWLSDVDEDTFYKWQRRASDTIAGIMREEELKAGRR